MLTSPFWQGWRGTPARADTVPDHAEKLDQYGGYVNMPVPGGATGFFRIGRLGNRIIFATPEGNAFWMRAVYGIDITDGGWQIEQALRKRYNVPSGIPWQPWVRDVVQRLRRWGFNAIGEYSSNYAFPVETYYRRWNNPEQMPFVYVLNGSTYAASKGVRNVFDLDFGRFPRVHRGEMRDVFDPTFEAAFREIAMDARSEKVFVPTPLTNSPWLLGTTIDDADYTHGLKNIGQPHIGWVVAVGKPNHSKAALRDMLKVKYSTITGLNVAWNSNYSTFESDGAWPNGKGFLDESGRGAWLGADAWALSAARPVVKADLFTFLERFADKYFSTAASAARAYTPHHLVFGPAALGVAQYPEVFKAAGRHLDVLQVFGSSSSEFWANVDNAYKASGKPLFVWKTLLAQKDSPLKAKAAEPWWEDYPTQADRGRAYDAFLRRVLGTPGIVGVDWWAYMDKVTGGESSNFGLVNTSDDPYEPFVTTIARTHSAIGGLLKQGTL